MCWQSLSSCFPLLLIWPWRGQDEVVFAHIMQVEPCITIITSQTCDHHHHHHCCCQRTISQTSVRFLLLSEKAAKNQNMTNHDELPSCSQSIMQKDNRLVCTSSNDDMIPYSHRWLYVALVMWDVSNTAALAQPAKWIQNIPNLLRLAQFAKGTVDDICGGDQQGSLHPRHTCHHRWRALSSPSEFCHKDRVCL